MTKDVAVHGSWSGSPKPQVTVSVVRPKTEGRKPTPEAYGDWQHAYDYFNERLFGGHLRDCIITLTRRKGVYGYFRPEAFEDTAGNVAHEIGINSAHLEELGDSEALSTLAHEMCHLWREDCGPRNKKGRGPSIGYHDRAWAAKMEEVGLLPTSTGEPGGKRTGYRVTHLIVEGGPFDLGCRELLASGFTITWHDRVPEPLPVPDEDADDEDGQDTQPPRRKKNDRRRFTCPDCSLNAWAKPGAALVCGQCGVPLFRSDGTGTTGRNS